MTEHSGGNEANIEIALVGDLTEHEADLTEKLLEIPRGGNCTLYIDSPGGSAYSAMSLLSVISLRNLQITGIVTGECSSAALWPFAACCRRFVTPFSVFLFHPMKWQSDENVNLSEAAEWARHFENLEESMDCMLAKFLDISVKQLQRWMEPGRYITGPEMAAAGVVELIEIEPSRMQMPPSAQAPRRRTKIASNRLETNTQETVLAQSRRKLAPSRKMNRLFRFILEHRLAIRFVALSASLRDDPSTFLGSGKIFLSCCVDNHFCTGHHCTGEGAILVVVPIRHSFFVHKVSDDRY